MGLGHRGPGSSPALRGLSVPDSEEDIRAIQEIKGTGLVRFLPVFGRRQSDDFVRLLK